MSVSKQVTFFISGLDCVEFFMSVLISRMIRLKQLTKDVIKEYINLA